MGFHTVNLVLNNSCTTGSARAVLIVLAHRCDDNTRETFPSIHRIALDAGLDDRSVKRLLKKIETAGEIEIKKRLGQWRTKGGIQHSNVYRITVPLFKGSDLQSPPLSAKVVTACPKGSDTQSPKGVTETTKGSGLQSPYQPEDQSTEKPEEQSTVSISGNSFNGGNDDEQHDNRRNGTNQKRPPNRGNYKATSRGAGRSGQYLQTTMVPDLTPRRKT